MRPAKTMLAAVLSASLLSAAVCGTARSAQVWDFMLESAGGERVSLREAASGKPVLLIFWATWCPHCKEAIPEINGIRSRHSERLQVLAINYMEKRGKVRAFMKEKGIAYPVLLDSDGKVAGRYNVLGIPTYILLDREGRIVYYGNDLPSSIEKYL